MQVAWTRLRARVEGIRDEIQDVIDEEQEYYDAMPESFQNGEKGERAQEAIEALEEAHEAMEWAEVPVPEGSPAMLTSLEWEPVDARDIDVDDIITALDNAKSV